MLLPIGVLKIAHSGRKCLETDLLGCYSRSEIEQRSPTWSIPKSTEFIEAYKKEGSEFMQRLVAKQRGRAK